MKKSDDLQSKVQKEKFEKRERKILKAINALSFLPLHFQLCRSMTVEFGEFHFFTFHLFNLPIASRVATL